MVVRSEQGSGVRVWSARIARFLVIVLALFTAVSLVAADAWWIRVFDFPRLQFAMVLTIALALLLFTRSRRLWLWLPLGVAALAVQLWQVVPYFGFMPQQAVSADSCEPADRLHVASLNVLQSNRDFDRAIAYVREENPDVFLAMENDAAWTDALSAALDADYPHSMKIPQPNTYGMALWSRLPFAEVERNELAGGGTPSIKARLTRADGGVMTLFAVHPRPPRPGQDSGQRDAELVLLADLVRDSGRPTLVVGDFNDVGWSSVTETFQRIGQLVDPRRGRGFNATFDATNPLMRWPLDHVFHTDDFGVLRFAKGPDVGSDHYPLEVELCLSPGEFAPQQEAPDLTREAVEDAREELEDASKGGEGFEADNLTATVPDD